MPVKPVPAFTVIGQSPRRKDALEKVTGKATYAGDIAVPGALYARILGRWRAPSVKTNTDGSRQQMEGSIMMGLGYALTEEVHFKDGEVLERNFDSYEIPRLSWLPKIETILIDNPETPASGCGEPPIVNMGAVIANAIYDAVGARLLQLPMTPARVKEALKRG